MSVPTPASVQKITEARKAREAELASSLASAKEKLPPTKATRKPREDKRPTSRKGESSSSRSSDRKPSRPDTSNRSTVSPSKAAKPKSSRISEKSQKPFERPEHLTSRPLQGHSQLEALKKSLQPSSKARSGSNNRAPHTVPASRTKQSRVNNSKKENN